MKKPHVTHCMKMHEKNACDSLHEKCKKKWMSLTAWKLYDKNACHSLHEKCMKKIHVTHFMKNA